MTFPGLEAPLLKPVRRTLIVAAANAMARLPVRKETLGANLVRAVFDAVSLGAYLASLGYRVECAGAQRILEQLPAEEETALGEVPDANT